MTLKLSDFSYTLPEALIAQQPAQPRDTSKLMVLDRASGKIEHKTFRDLPDLLSPTDVLVLNDSKVFPARIKGRKATGKPIEVVLLRQEDTQSWWSMSFPGLKIGNTLLFDNLTAQVIDRDDFSGHVLLKFNLSGETLMKSIYQVGQTPIPPYIHQTNAEYKLSETTLRTVYQTVFAKEVGSAAAPTAGLHFTPKLLAALVAKGIQIEYVTLHVGPGTFQRLWQENIDNQKLHTEWYEITPDTAKRLITAKRQGKRIIPVGTTTTRTLEAAFRSGTNSSLTDASLRTGWQSTQLFIQPGYKFQLVDALITNFHVPESSLLMLVAAFTSQPQTKTLYKTFDQSLIGRAYQQAIEANYRFYSFGDAMLIG